MKMKDDHPGLIRPLYSNRSELKYELDLAMNRAEAAASAVPSGDLSDREPVLAELRQRSTLQPVTIRDDQATTKRETTDVIVPPGDGSSRNWSGDDVMQPGLKVTVVVPFSGARMLLQHKASTHEPLPCSSRLLDGKIELSKTFVMPITVDQIREWRATALATLTANAEAANADVRAHNERIAGMLPGVIDQRLSELDALNAIADELD